MDFATVFGCTMITVWFFIVVDDRLRIAKQLRRPGWRRATIGRRTAIAIATDYVRSLKGFPGGRVETERTEDAWKVVWWRPPPSWPVMEWTITSISVSIDDGRILERMADWCTFPEEEPTRAMSLNAPSQSDSNYERLDSADDENRGL